MTETVCLEKSIGAVSFCKIDTEKMQVFGVVAEPCNPDACPVDAQGDIWEEAEIVKMRDDFMAALRQDEAGIDVLHEFDTDAFVIESVIVPVDFEIGDPAQLVRKGSWYLGVQILDTELWKDVKDRKITAFSIHGTAERVPA